MGWEERVWGYTGAGGLIQAFAAGYFVWDFGICAGNVDIFGWGMLAHAVSALVVFGLGFVSFPYIFFSICFRCWNLEGDIRPRRTNIGANMANKGMNSAPS